MFKPGDRVRCVEEHMNRTLTYGCVYTVERVEAGMRVYLSEVRNTFWGGAYAIRRFVCANTSSVEDFED